MPSRKCIAPGDGLRECAEKGRQGFEIEVCKMTGNRPGSEMLSTIQCGSFYLLQSWELSKETGEAARPKSISG